MGFPAYGNYPSVASGDEKYKNDPYWKAFKKQARSDTGNKNRIQFADGELKVALSRNKYKNNAPEDYREDVFAKFVAQREFFDAMRARAQSVSDEKSDRFAREGAAPGAGASARDVTSFATTTRDSFSKTDAHPGFSADTKNKKLDKTISQYGFDPYFAEYLAESKRNNSSVFRKGQKSKSFASKLGGGFDFNKYVTFVNKKAAADRTAKRIEAANPVIDEITQDGLAGGSFPLDSANADGDVITTLTGAQIEAAFLDPNVELVQDANGNYIGYRSTQGVTEVADTSDTSGTLDTLDTSDTSGTEGTEGTGTLSEVTGYDESLSDEDVQNMLRGGAGPGNTPIDGVFYNDAGGAIGFLTEADRSRYNAAQDASQNPTINIAGSLYDYNGNYVGADPNTINVGGSLYDREGNYLGPAQAGATGGTIGGASSDNVMFDAYTAEQEAASARAAEAVELMDAGYGRYNAAVRKLGIVGRQGEEYAPLILDQLRMAEQEAAQPQLAAFGFGLNPQLGGMPQIGVQGVQGNTGGQSALTAMSNAGLNQLQLAQQPYNRIALPAIDSATGQPDFSQVNNPTIFKASTDV